MPQSPQRPGYILSPFYSSSYLPTLIAHTIVLSSFFLHPVSVPNYSSPSTSLTDSLHPSIRFHSSRLCRQRCVSPYAVKAALYFIEAYLSWYQLWISSRQEFFGQAQFSRQFQNRGLLTERFVVPLPQPSSE